MATVTSDAEENTNEGRLDTVIGQINCLVFLIRMSIWAAPVPVQLLLLGASDKLCC